MFYSLVIKERRQGFTAARATGAVMIIYIYIYIKPLKATRPDTTSQDGPTIGAFTGAVMINQVIIVVTTRVVTVSGAGE